MDIIQELQEVFMDVLDLEELTISRETTAQDIDEWDSLSHIMLIVAIEKRFKIKFTSREIQSWKNVGEMIDCIQTKLV